MGLRQVSEMSGLSKSALSRYENGDPNIESALDTICKVLGINPNEEWEEVAQRLGDKHMAQDQMELEEQSNDVYIGNLTPAHQQTVKDFIDFLKLKERK